MAVPPPFAQIEAALQSKWARHRALLDADPGYHLRGRTVDWIARDEYAHHWRWLAYELTVARARVSGTAWQPIDDVDAANDAWTAEDRARSFEEARDLATAVFDEYVAFHGVLPEEARTEVVLEAFQATADHLDEHLGYMVAGALEDESSDWEALTALLDARPAGTLYRDGSGTDVTASDTYAHVARWMELNLGRVDAFLATGVVPELEAEVDVLNARWAQADAALGFAEARRRAFLARDRFMGQFRGIPVERLTARLVGIYHGNAWGHYQEHLGYLGQPVGPS